MTAEIGVYNPLDEKQEKVEYVIITASGSINRVAYALEIAERLEALRRLHTEGASEKVVIIDATQSDLSLEELLDKLPEEIRKVNVTGMPNLALSLLRDYQPVEAVSICAYDDYNYRTSEKAYARNLLRTEEERSRSMMKKVSGRVFTRKRF